MFESTIPQGEAELMRASSYRRYLNEAEADVPRLGDDVVVGSRQMLLSPSLQADLQRFEHRRHGADSLDVLEVLAACVRHANRVTVHIECAAKVVPLTVFPLHQLVHCPLRLQELCGLPLPSLRVMHVEPAVLQPPGEDNPDLVGAADRHFPLAQWLWVLAWRGARAELLPEIAGPAAYRVNPGFEWDRLPMNPNLRSAVQRLRRDAVNLRELAEWPGLGRERAIRLLNALYLQAGLIVSRTHPEAAAESWFGALGL